MDHQTDSETVSESDGDTFDDAPEVTPRPSSLARPLIDRMSSSSAASHHTESNYSPDPPSSTRDDSGGAEKGGSGQVEQITQGSPPLTSRRISVSSMDDVNLEDGTEKRFVSEATAGTQSLVSKQSNRSSVASLTQSKSNVVTTEKSSPAKPATEKSATLPAPAQPTRKLTSPFSWLSRNTSAEKKPSPPSAVPRSKDKPDTVSSVATIESNPELMLNRIEGTDDSDHSGQFNANRNSLRDRFKFLRMREEAGITSLDEESVSTEQHHGGALAGLIGRSTNLGLGIGSPTSFGGDEKNENSNSSSRRDTQSSGTMSPARRQTININLAPGTAAGIAVGPTEETAPPVDWDLWQSVVYEGPQAVVKTSPEELNHAIVSGIPQAIRGVVWQVLAQSKNSGLEEVYRELTVRGTDKERLSSGPIHPQPNGGQMNGVKEKDSIASSSSSVHSDYSTPATTNASNNTLASSPHHSHDGQASDVIGKFQAKSVSEKPKDLKMEVAAIRRLEKAIKRDLGARTSYSKYLMAAGLQDGLFGICKAYALFDEPVGYAQGINFIAMPLLFNMPEEEAFCLLVRLMNQYGLRDLFIQDMPGLHMHLYQFERLLEDFEPALYCHLSRRSVHPQLYATQWFLTLFAYRFPLQLVLRIYDLILSEGLEGAILKFGIVLMQKNAQALVAMQDMSALTTFLKERLFDVYIDKTPSASSLLESGFFGSTSGIDKEVYRADMLVRDACSVKIRPETLRKYAAEWREKQRVEKEREAEVESLRQQCSHLTWKVRSLEERAEKSDQEHVHVASELVRTKVDNEVLRDSNESLQGEVDELKRIVETQTEEVEKRLKEEMDTVMQRNIEVHNANRALEEQMSEMERDLVETKLQYAQINSEYETLKQRWNSVSAMLHGQ